MKAGAIGRLGDVMKLLQTQQRYKSLMYAGFCQLGSLFQRATCSEVWWYHPWEIFKSTSSQASSVWQCDTSMSRSNNFVFVQCPPLPTPSLFCQHSQDLDTLPHY